MGDRGEGPVGQERTQARGFVIGHVNRVTASLVQHRY